jgi:hypothetical protein
LNRCRHAGGSLLEVVNHNVVDRQYVVAGELRALDILGHALSLARKDPVAARDPPALLKRAFAVTEQRLTAAAAAGVKLTLEQGEATIPLPGIDVPFHSRFLLGGVPGVLPGKVVVIGGGTAGVNAARMGTGLGADVTILEVDLERMRFLDITMGTAHTLYSSESSLLDLLPTVDLLIGAVLDPGAKAPKLITREMLRLMKPHSVVVDIASGRIAGRGGWARFECPFGRGVGLSRFRFRFGIGKGRAQFQAFRPALAFHL